MEDKNTLEHHGILGMKWGVRRYQNEDGSLTPAGQKRYAHNTAKLRKSIDRYNKAYQKAKNKDNKYFISRTHVKNVAETLRKMEQKGMLADPAIQKELVLTGKKAMKDIMSQEGRNSLYRFDTTLRNVNIATVAGNTIANPIIGAAAGISAYAITQVAMSKAEAPKNYNPLSRKTEEYIKEKWNIAKR